MTLVIYTAIPAHYIVTPAQAGVFRTPLRAEEVLAFASMTERWREYGVQLNSKTERNSDFF